MRGRASQETWREIRAAPRHRGCDSWRRCPRAFDGGTAVAVDALAVACERCVFHAAGAARTLACGEDARLAFLPFARAAVADAPRGALARRRASRGRIAIQIAPRRHPHREREEETERAHRGDAQALHQAAFDLRRWRLWL